MDRVFVYEHLCAGGEAGAPEVAELLPQGQAMRDAIVTDLLAAGHAVSAATSDRAGAVPSGAQAVQPAGGETMAAFIERLAAAHDWTWVIAPETGGCLAALTACVPPARRLGCALEAIVLASSKRATLERLQAHGVPTPADHAGAAGRWVVKPDDGAGAADTRVHATLAAAQADLAARGPGAAVLEPWVEGDAMSLSLLCSTGGTELLSVNRQQLRVEPDAPAVGGAMVHFDGVAIDVLPHADPLFGRLAELAAQVQAAIPGLRGFVGVDVVLHPVRAAVVIEVNPRPTMALAGLSQRLQRNLAAAVVAARRRGD